MLENNGLLFTMTDLKQYVYCPRIFFYHACLPKIRPVTYKMQVGIETHDEERTRAARRSLTMYGVNVEGQRHFDVSIVSTKRGLSGQVDEVVETDHEIIPVDYKLAQKAGRHFQIQLAAYGLLLEEHFQRPVKRGFLYLIPSRKAHEIPITSKLRREVKQTLIQMRNIAEREQMPAPTDWRQRCVDCEFRRFCNDV